MVHGKAVRLGWAVVMAAGVGLTAHAATPAKASTDKLSAQAEDTAAPPAAAHRTRVVKSWPEDFVVDGQKVRGNVEIVFDYTDGVAIERHVYGPENARKVASSRTNARGHGSPRPSPEEIEEAMDMVRNDKEIAQIIEVTHAVLDGGFQIFGKPGTRCGPGSRCLEVQLMTDNRLGFIRNVIVDLTKDAIVYRNYLPVPDGDGEGN